MHPTDRRRRAAATVEFALVLPILLFFFAVGADFARVYQHLQTLSVCARNGAIYASDSAIASHSPYEDVTEATLADAGRLREQVRVETRATQDPFGNPCVEITVRCPFEPVVPTLGIPRRIDLHRAVTMRICRPEEQTDPAP